VLHDRVSQCGGGVQRHYECPRGRHLGDIGVIVRLVEDGERQTLGIVEVGLAPVAERTLSSRSADGTRWTSETLRTIASAAETGSMMSFVITGQVGQVYWL